MSVEVQVGIYIGGLDLADGELDARGHAAGHQDFEVGPDFEVTAAASYLDVVAA